MSLPARLEEHVMFHLCCPKCVEPIKVPGTAWGDSYLLTLSDLRDLDDQLHCEWCRELVDPPELPEHVAALVAALPPRQEEEPFIVSEPPSEPADALTEDSADAEMPF